MATPERLAPSRRLQSAATAERDRLGRELGRLDAKAQELRAGLDQIEATRAELRDQLSLLARLAHSTEDSPFPLRARHLRAVGEEEPPPTKATLRGARIREKAVCCGRSEQAPRRERSRPRTPAPGCAPRGAPWPSAPGSGHRRGPIPPKPACAPPRAAPPNRAPPRHAQPPTVRQPAPTWPLDPTV